MKKRKILNVLIILAMGIGLIYLYTFLHEGSHALMAILFGGKLTAFDVNVFGGNPHVKYAGDFSSAQRAIISIAGPTGPLLVWLVFMLFVNKKRNLFFQKVAFIVSGAMLGSLVPNIFIPIIHEFGGNTARQDISWFITHTGASGFAVSLVVAMLLAFCIWLVFSKIKVLPALKYQLPLPAKNFDRT